MRKVYKVYFDDDTFIAYISWFCKVNKITYSEFIRNCFESCVKCIPRLHESFRYFIEELGGSN